MEKFVVIDSETTWTDNVMSIGAAVADGESMEPLQSRYYIINPEYRAGGMYSASLMRRDIEKPVICSRAEALQDLINLCKENGVSKVFAYNALFDLRHLPELSFMRWFDIMKLAAYVQYNPAIPRDAPVYSTGRLKSGYGVQSVMRMLTGNRNYFETHNALKDTLDELKIMLLLGRRLEEYI